MLLPREIPLSVGWSEARLAQLKAADDDPYEVVAMIAPGPGSQGVYAESAIQQVLREVVARTANGGLGHQDPDTISRAFPEVVVRWIGGTWSDGRAYLRGLVDRNARQVKDWLRSGAITTPSIFYADPKVEYVGGVKTIVGFDRLMSVDFAPLGRAGSDPPETRQRRGHVYQARGRPGDGQSDDVGVRDHVSGQTQTRSGKNEN
jgi:hypothetical protein